ncbi:Hypothetical protein, putative [Bodo saltans]|uniref:GAR domain-containing protein n=1 Tax=Bodo saltans TaxID=75058 RepID=A0A0S4JHA8_BODSA|nr:Hypothetical protein, putative [Bodo saltans]|eukprot:CUG89403.1 Hypothetical protein, putative [Bodo saltans]
MASTSSSTSSNVNSTVRALVEDFLSLHQKRLLSQVDAFVTATLAGRSDDDVDASSSSSTAPNADENGAVREALDARFRRWHIAFNVPFTITKDWDGARQRLAAACPPASQWDLLVARIRAETRGFSEADALRALEKQFNIARRRGQSFVALKVEESTGAQSVSPIAALRPVASTIRQAAESPSPTTTATTTAPIERPALVAVKPVEGKTDPQQEDLREWILALLNPEMIAAHPNLVALAPLVDAVKSSANVVDLLRDGLLMSFLVQSLRALPPPSIKLPKRITGFYRRDNVSACLKDVATHFPQFHVTAMLDVGDIVIDDDNTTAAEKDRKDRRVMTFLLNMSKAALRGGQYSGPVPVFVQLDEEIDKEAATITEAEMSTACDDDPQINSSPAASQVQHGAVQASGVSPPSALPVEEVAASPVPYASTSLPEPSKPVDVDVISKREINAAVEEGDDAPAAAAAPEYVPCYGDAIDEGVGALMNRTLQKFPGLANITQLKRLARSGAYVIYHRISKKKTLVHIRAMRSTLMIRVGGGWDVLEHWLSRHAVDMLGKAAAR